MRLFDVATDIVGMIDRNITILMILVNVQTLILKFHGTAVEWDDSVIRCNVVEVINIISNRKTMKWQ